MANYKIYLIEQDCIGCGACAAVSDNWKMDYDKGKSFFVKRYLDELKTNKEAAEGCPTQCIKITQILQEP